MLVIPVKGNLVICPLDSMHLEVVHVDNSMVHPIGTDRCDPCYFWFYMFVRMKQNRIEKWNEKKIIASL